MFKLSVVIPVYNERNTLEQIIGRVEAVPISKEIVIVDDGSVDGTRRFIQESFAGKENFRIILHDKNRGKGAAVRSGIEAASGDAVIIQDADLEYNPQDYPLLLGALQKNGVNVVYGSRFLGKKGVTSFWHRAVNYFLTAFTNVLFGSKLTDMETCYKLYRRPTLLSLGLRSEGFEIEVELAAKTLLKKEPIVEVPISYKGRSFHEGKKIGWRDGIKAVCWLVRHRLFSK